MSLSNFLDIITNIIIGMDSYTLVSGTSVTLLSFIIYITVLVIVMKIIKEVI